jgi:hypothetical protein
MGAAGRHPDPVEGSGCDADSGWGMGLDHAPNIERCEEHFHGPRRNPLNEALVAGHNGA